MCHSYILKRFTSVLKFIFQNLARLYRGNENVTSSIYFFFFPPFATFFFGAEVFLLIVVPFALGAFFDLINFTAFFLAGAFLAFVFVVFFTPFKGAFALVVA